MNHHPVPMRFWNFATMQEDRTIHEAICVHDGRTLRIFDPDSPEEVPSISTNVYTGPTDSPEHYTNPHRRHAR